MESGLGSGAVKSIGRLLGFASFVPRIGSVAAGAFRTKLNELAKHMTARDLDAVSRELKGEVVAWKGSRGS